MKYFIAIILFLAVGGVSAFAYFTQTVSVFSDTKSGGWADKISDDAFVLSGLNCTIQWNAIHYKDGGNALMANVSRCTLNFAEQLKKHRIILAKINQRWPLKNFEILYWGSFCRENTKPWCRHIINGSKNAPALLKFIKKYPLSGWKGPQALYLSLGKATKQYKSLLALLSEFDIKVGSLEVEKVEKGRLDKIAKYYDIPSLKPSFRRGHKFPWVVFGGSNLAFHLKGKAVKR